MRRRRRPLSLTPLVDVIFLLLLFFMLSSTFTRFAEVDLSAAAPGGSAATPETKPLFLQLAPEGLRLNGRDMPLEALADTLALAPAEGMAADAQPVLVALRGAVSAQRLTDLLVVLRAVPGIRVTVLGAS
ncbi:biopolymer transporter ExbD [Rhodovulum kholense]|uniref:Outer membrane transport energization protein ExbD n=1 Tax=Rhodovulum kholense TaxID=453584 RepID=A0A8E2VK71_9RHOB|nr:biopolymer transporter ExbD [Rhodovulum kholense]PTW50229.1 outer membrane transport energization protein ExbD [Rhodovulum kholense]